MVGNVVGVSSSIMFTKIVLPLKMSPTKFAIEVELVFPPNVPLTILFRCVPSMALWTNIEFSFHLDLPHLVWVKETLEY
jgi:hypothetical protein